MDTVIGSHGKRCTEGFGGFGGTDGESGDGSDGGCRRRSFVTFTKTNGFLDGYETFQGIV